jgi:hypothetical protein
MGYDKVIRIRATAEEAETLKTESDKVGLSVSAFIRLLVRNWHDGIRFEKEERGK